MDPLHRPAIFRRSHSTKYRKPYQSIPHSCRFDGQFFPGRGLAASIRHTYGTLSTLSSLSSLFTPTEVTHESQQGSRSALPLQLSNELAYFEEEANDRTFLEQWAPRNLPGFGPEFKTLIKVRNLISLVGDGP